MSITAQDLSLLRGLRSAIAPRARGKIHFIPKRGMEHYRAVLSDAEVRKMREQYVAWTPIAMRDSRGHRTSHGYATLALKFRCGPATVRDIVQGRTRKDAGGPIAPRGGR